MNSKFWKFLPLIWVLFGFLIFGLVIYGAEESDNKSTLLTTINSLNSENVERILIEPENLDWNINLTDRPILITEKSKINEILNALKRSEKVQIGKGIPSNWECKLRIDFKYPDSIKLKNNEELVLEIENTAKGQVFELPNVMEYQHYATKELKESLEAEANFKRPLGKIR